MSEEVNDRLREVELQLARMLAHLRSELGDQRTRGNLPRQLKEIHQEISELKEMINGNIDQPGLAVRLDRLEQAGQRRAKVEGMTISVIIGLIAKAIFDLVSH